MKPCVLVVLLKTLFVAAYVGTTACDKDGGDGMSSSETREGGATLACPAEFGDDRLSVSAKIGDILKECFGRPESDISERVLDTGSLEEVRTYYRGFCRQRSTVRDCFAEKSSVVGACPDDDGALSKSFSIARDVVAENFLEDVCVDDGVRMSALVHGINVATRGENRPVLKEFLACGSEGIQIVKAVERTGVDLASKLYIVHGVIRRTRECVGRTRLGEDLKEIVNHILDGITASMKCLHPVGGGFVTCTSVDAAMLNATRVCEARSHGGGAGGDRRLAEGHVGRCFDHVTSRTHREAVVAEVCSSETLAVCLQDEKAVAELCLNATENVVFARGVDFLASAMNAACFDRDRSLATIATGVHRLETSGRGRAVWDCVDVATSTRRLDSVAASGVAGSRHEELIFRECLATELGARPSLDAGRDGVR